MVFQDLTELRRAEEQLRRVDRLAALGALSAAAGPRDSQPAGLDAGLGPDARRGKRQRDPPAGWASSSARRTGWASWWTTSCASPGRPRPLRRPAISTSWSARRSRCSEADPLACGREPRARVRRTPRGRRSGPAPAGPDQPGAQRARRRRPGRHGAGLASAGPMGQARIRVWDSAGSISSADLARIFEPFFTDASRRNGPRAVDGALHRAGPRRPDPRHLLPWRGHRVRRRFRCPLS